jgi:hypothetical protein
MIPKQHFSEPSLISLSHMDMNDAPLIQLTRDVGSTSSSTVFGWSDIPCQGDDPMQCATSRLAEEFYYHYCLLPSPSPPPPSNVFTLQPEAPIMLLPQRRISIPVVPAPPVLPLVPPLLSSQSHAVSSLPSSPRSTIQCDDLEGTLRKTAAAAKHVSFAPTVHVRTHTVTVGDHPCCTGGMALTCGWESIDSMALLPELDNDTQCEQDTAAVAMDQQRWSSWHESPSSSSLPPSLPFSPRRRGHRSHRAIMHWHLSYEARRQRLQEVTGWAESQLLWEEYRLARGGDNEAKESTTTAVLHSTI